ncbi:transmembrane protein 229B-like [Zootoca vivipara]|uniref:transmembrane protein 229B-like n=1 Tax=Zootoca vivipara TaxID=8524 RepID=UPI00159242A7|nr:transmembrane protein 229B-like [Zootoca vivipara]
MGTAPEPLNLLCRTYLYAFHGYLLEILFTAIILGEDWAFQGATTLLSFFVYGTCGLALERLYTWLRNDCCLFTRCLLYSLCIYLWQFSTGYILSCFGACPWDFSGFYYNFMGIVALEHSLIWFVGSLLLEKWVISNVLRLRLDEPWKAKARPMPKFALKDD